LSDADLLARLVASARRRETPCGDGAMVWHEWGEGPPLVLLHGGSGSWRHWARNLPALVPGWRVLAPDLPGLGESAMPPRGTGLWPIARIILQGLDLLLGPETRCDLVGFSFGAVISGHVAALSGGRLRSVTLVGAGALGLRRDPVALEKVREKTGVARVEANRTNLARLMFADPARIDELALEIQDWNTRHARLRSRDITSASALRDALARSRVPVQAIYGAFDAIAYPYMQERVDFFATLPEASPLQVIPGAGHWVAFEAAEAFNAALLARLARA
jgi:pimeloyl-ACP methyl ester carboxylesterase